MKKYLAVLMLVLFIGCNKEDELKPVSSVTINPPANVDGDGSHSQPAGDSTALPASTTVPADEFKADESTPDPKLIPPETAPEKPVVSKPKVTPPAADDTETLANAPQILKDAKEAIDDLKIDIASAKLKSLESVRAKLPPERLSQYLRYQDALQSAKTIKEHKAAD